ncbi:L-lactate dehydrogenase complex protein LldG [Chryseolinea serpens]|uniref:L-lactate dehydrogenase complex protein LldG n=1 Tax=Chryseolinea serpens TaxID=947013 RepID=A0A1M5TC11_9BACT|nr:LUD domain-containing protein [Chryseolinea serpens]SHH48221.1 L-lactate dehydrogenase complex protein LldG [Chryseolinea serpens]
MESRKNILDRIKQNQPHQNFVQANYFIHPILISNLVEKFKATLTAIGASVFEIATLEELNHFTINSFPNCDDVLTYIPGHVELERKSNGHAYQNIKVAILKGDLAVAENGAIWITDKNMLDRALPFICENLVLVVDQNDIVQTLHDAYSTIEIAEYKYGTFIAGPSKTADIEQSLVLGAHGPKTLTVLIQKSDLIRTDHD